ncbi:1-acyl-sn-glycerol-3-phosphate acyltransferase [Rhodopirellula sp.]|nr:1-acyl-sn-glycerol-3-phosphate acyltransferase [Rhodopirellula sp.]
MFSSPQRSIHPLHFRANMQSVVIEEAYEFVPPYHGTWWARILQRLMPRWLRKSYGIESIECEGLEHIQESLKAGHGVLLAPNHCRPADPAVIHEVCNRLGLAPHTMASWHLFKQSWLQRFMLRRLGAFSVYREGMDRQALQVGVDILAEARRPLVIFPEGVITRTNDRLLALMDGVSFIARSAAKKRAAMKPPGKVVVHAIGIRYHFHGDIDEAIHQTLDDIEKALSWRPRRDPNPTNRIYRVGEALLWLKEIEYLGEPQSGPIPERVENLINQILIPIEEEWLNGKNDGTIVNRVKQLRIEILRDMITADLPEEERQRRWNQLADMYIAQQLGHYPPTYVKSDPSKERQLETVEKFEEDLTDVSRIHRPMSVTVRIGPAIPVATKRDRKAAEDPVMAAIEKQLHQLLDLPDVLQAEENLSASPCSKDTA